MNKKRYFYITYTYEGSGITGVGCYTLESKEYPSDAGIEEQARNAIRAKKNIIVESVMVNNIMEMNERDFKSFTKSYRP